jgi:hydroxymethylglutaryl-CoA synthase
MVAISSVAGYVPLYRVEREAIAEQYGGSAHGETAVPGRDENNITMACEAATKALDRSTVTADNLSGVYAASVTDTFAEHGIAAHVSYRIGATGNLDTADFQGTTRAATDALAAAEHTVTATDAPVLVVATDIMPVEPGDDNEAYQGAGAGALILSSDDDETVAELVSIGRETTGFVESHRLHGETAEQGDKRYEAEYGFGAVQAASQRALAEAAETPSNAIINLADQRVAKSSVDEFPGQVDYQSTFNEVGYAGTASYFLDIAHFTETASQGDLVIAVNYGAGGVDAAVIRRTTDRDSFDGLTVAEQSDAKEIITYAKHHEYREQIEYEGTSI